MQGSAVLKQKLPTRTTLLAVLFVLMVVVITYLHHTLLLPLFVGMLITLKAWLKLLTPKFFVLFFKNSIFLKSKQLLIKSSTRFVVLSHKPLQHKIRQFKSLISNIVLSLIGFYQQSPLWVRTALAVGALFATASSSYVVIALLIIPQPILNWLRRTVITILNRSGVTHISNTTWKHFAPSGWQYKWYMHRKWTIGRRQVATAQKIRKTIADKARRRQQG